MDAETMRLVASVAEAGAQIEELRDQTQEARLPHAAMQQPYLDVLPALADADAPASTRFSIERYDDAGAKQVAFQSYDWESPAAYSLPSDPDDATAKVLVRSEEAGSIYKRYATLSALAARMFSELLEAGTYLGDVLHWNPTAGQWKASVTGGPSADDMLRWDGTKYVKTSVGDGLQIAVEALKAKAYHGITVNANGISVKADNGIAVSADGVTVDSGDGIVVSADGVEANLGHGLEFDTSTPKAVRVKAYNGITVDANGVSVKAHTGIAVTGDGVACTLTGVPSTSGKYKYQVLALTDDSLTVGWDWVRFKVP